MLQNLLKVGLEVPEVPEVPGVPKVLEALINRCILGYSLFGTFEPCIEFLITRLNSLKIFDGQVTTCPYILLEHQPFEQFKSFELLEPFQPFEHLEPFEPLEPLEPLAYFSPLKNPIPDKIFFVMRRPASFIFFSLSGDFISVTKK